MGYYDYSSYFQQLINKQTTIISNQDLIIKYLQFFIFIFVVYFLWKFISNMIRGRY